MFPLSSADSLIVPAKGTSSVSSKGQGFKHGRFICLISVTDGVFAQTNAR